MTLADDVTISILADDATNNSNSKISFWKFQIFSGAWLLFLIVMNNDALLMLLSPATAVSGELKDFIKGMHFVQFYSAGLFSLGLFADNNSNPTESSGKNISHIVQKHWHMFFTHMAQLIDFFLSAVDVHVYMKTEEYMWLYTMDLFYTMQWIFVD